MKYAILTILILSTACTTIAATEPKEDAFNYTIKFCGNCMNALLEAINNSEHIACALYNLDEQVVKALENKKADVIVNSDSKAKSQIIFKRNAPGLMHNKFCIFDKTTVWTGSWNPTSRNTKDDVIIINSKLLAENYMQEFNELKNDKNQKTAVNRIILNSTPVENYFCPEDNCIKTLQRKIAKANKSIHFATYSFTHPKIANELIIKKSQGVKIKGIMKKGSKYSQFQTLKDNNIDVTEYAQKGLLHHKLFIIDNHTVITGSFNPTRNGDRKNDENFLAIENDQIAATYLNYHSKLLNTYKPQT